MRPAYPLLAPLLAWFPRRAGAFFALAVAAAALMAYLPAASFELAWDDPGIVAEIRRIKAAELRRFLAGRGVDPPPPSRPPGAE